MKIILKSSDGFGSMILNTKNAPDMKHECLIDTKGFCLICIKKLFYDKETSLPPPQSLDWLESHLDISFRKWLVENEFISETTDRHFLLKLIEKGVNYQAKLCSECASTAKALSMSCGQSTAGSGKELDVISTLRVIQNIIEESDKSDRMEEFYKETMTWANPDQIQRAALTSIGRRLRKDIIDKCSSQVQYLEEQLRKVTLVQSVNGTGTSDSDEVKPAITEIREKASAQVIPDEEQQFQRQQINEIGTTSAIPVMESPVGAQPGPSERSVPTELSQPSSSRLPVFGHVIGTRQSKRLKSKSTESQRLQDVFGVVGLEHVRNTEVRTPMSKVAKTISTKLPTPTSSQSMGNFRARIEINPAPSTSASESIRRTTRHSDSVIKSAAGRPSRPHQPKSKASSKKRVRTKPFRKHECLFCDKTYVSPIHLEVHLRVHTREAPYFCPKCDFSSKITGHLQAHLKTHLKNRKRTFPCDLCSKKFFTATNLYKHRKAHSEENSVTCDFCPKRFKTNWDLKMHRARMHLQKAAATCKTCGKHFADERLLIEHSRLIHAPRITCKICKKIISSKHTFRLHMKRVHNPNRKDPFKCGSCTKRFHTRVECNRHMNTHLDLAERVRPYQCAICKMAFQRKSELVKHQRVHSKRAI